MTSGAIICDRKRDHRNQKQQHNKLKKARVAKAKSESHKLLRQLLKETGVEK